MIGRLVAHRAGGGGKPRLGSAARLLAWWLAAAAAVPAFAQEPAAVAAAPEFEQILAAGEYRYARSRRAGVFVSFDQGHTWQARSNGLPHRIVYPFPDPPEYATVTSLAADPANPRRLAATTASAVYLSSNGGMAWQRVATGQLHPHAYLTSVALSPHDPSGMLLGTSFHGVYETTDGGATWQHLTPAIRFLTDRSLFYEEVAGLSYDPTMPSAMVVLAGFDGGIFYVTDRFGEQRDTPGTGLLRFPVPAMATVQVGFAPSGEGWELHAGTIDARWRLTANGSWSPIGGATAVRPGVPLQTSNPPDPAAPAEIEPPGAAEASPPPAPAAGQHTAPQAGAGSPAPAQPGSEQPSAPDTGTDQPTAPDTETGGATAAAVDPPAQPQPDGGRSEPAPDTGQPAAPATRADGAGIAAGDAPAQPEPDVARSQQAPEPADTEPPAMAAGDSGRAGTRQQAAGVAGIAAGLPRVPPPGCTSQEHTEQDSAEHHQAAAAQPVARVPGTTIAAAGQDGQPATASCDQAHMLAAGEPGWIAGPDGAGASVPHDRAALRTGIYIRGDRAAEALQEYLDLLARHGLDSLVIDFKNDHGRLSYDSELPLARAMGAAPGPIKLDRLIADAHAAGIYVIARLVVFKDPYLYDWDNHRVAIWDGELDEPWRHLVPAAGDDPDAKVQREHWVDPFAPEVWDYNVAVAEELAARGVDEIQFDYIRFPSDGPTERARYRHRRPGMRRMDAIESFLALARERLQVPISTDLFGFNSWYRAGNFIGQDIGVLAEYADVISPMFYPSHFPSHFLHDRSYVDRAYAIYETGVRRAQRMVQGRAHIRPYVQAFLIGPELRMEEDEYGRYLTRQLDGNRAAAGSGFTLWNASNRYYMVTEPLQPYFEIRREETP